MPADGGLEAERFAVFGLERVTSGEIELHGAVVRAPVPHSMLRAGLCYYPADRGAEGLALGRPGRENVTMAALDDPRLSQGGLLKSWRERRAIAAPLKTLGLRARRRTPTNSGPPWRSG
ncbi:hypothetical protein NLY36_20950 [Mesorhizobium sp. C399B]|uniref:hypothetical protein n=1 Tax=Mesorhizobium sp. C399B TaxID=2956833 RepID=UPI0025780459|nr:hypothetical protein [Mesorhizobium sp. C399B]WJI67344.1 hypothetical protein NLY36_20950 [Mesorhizobium sp. C399B]